MLNYTGVKKGIHLNAWIDILIDIRLPTNLPMKYSWWVMCRFYLRTGVRGYYLRTGVRGYYLRTVVRGYYIWTDIRGYYLQIVVRGYYLWTTVRGYYLRTAIRAYYLRNVVREYYLWTIVTHTDSYSVDKLPTPTLHTDFFPCEIYR